MTEEWRPAPNYEGIYEVSNRGDVRSVYRVAMRRNGTKYTVRGRVLRLQHRTQRLPSVVLARDGHCERLAIPRLVETAFGNDRNAA